MEYLPEQARVLYRSKDGKEQKSYDARDRLAAMGTHVPARGQQSVRSYGFLSNASRGKRRKEQDEGAEPLPTVLEPQAPPEGFGKNSAWARLIRKVYEVDPLECPTCGAGMRVIAFITDPAVVRKILEPLGLWLVNARPVLFSSCPEGNSYPFILVPGLAVRFIFFQHRISNGLLTRAPSDRIVAIAARLARRNHTYVSLLDRVFPRSAWPRIQYWSVTRPMSIYSAVPPDF